MILVFYCSLSPKASWWGDPIWSTDPFCGFNFVKYFPWSTLLFSYPRLLLSFENVVRKNANNSCCLLYYSFGLRRRKGAQHKESQEANLKIITIYAPMIYTAPCIMFWMRAHPLPGQVRGGWALEFERFFGLKTRKCILMYLWRSLEKHSS